MRHCYIKPQRGNPLFFEVMKSIIEIIPVNAGLAWNAAMFITREVHDLADMQTTHPTGSASQWA